MPPRVRYATLKCVVATLTGNHWRTVADLLRSAFETKQMVVPSRAV